LTLSNNNTSPIERFSTNLTDLEIKIDTHFRVF